MALTALLVAQIVSWIAALSAPIFLFFAYLKLPRAEFKTIIGWLTWAFVFTNLRWFGGKLTRSGIDFTLEPWFQWVWMALILLSAGCALIAAKHLYDMSTFVHLIAEEPKSKETFK